MGTKNNPSEFDCYSKALPDEPMFTLLGRDALASDFVELWAHLNNAAPLDAFETFVRLYRQIKMTEVDKAQVMEAYKVSFEMMNYWKDQYEPEKS